MPVLDGDFEAFVTNLGKYNEGMLVGEWVKLPTTEEEMQKVSLVRMRFGSSSLLNSSKRKSRPDDGLDFLFFKRADLNSLSVAVSENIR